MIERERDLPTTSTRDHQNVSLPLQVRAASVASGTIDAEARTVEVVWTTGARVARYSFMDGPYQEELDTSPKSVRLGRLNAGGPVLDSHNADGLDSVIGVVEAGTAKLAKGEGRAKVRFARDDERADAIWRKVEQGIIRAVSVGYRVHKMLESKAQDGSKILRAIDWEPFEISFVAVGADAEAGVRAEDRDATPCEIRRDPAIVSDDLAREIETREAYDAARREAYVAARQRATDRAVDIMELVGATRCDLPDREQICLAAKFIQRGATLDEVRAEVGMRPAAASYTPGTLRERMAARFAAGAAPDAPTNGSRAVDAMRRRFN
jgi:HK97 family phage prohead protease